MCLVHHIQRITFLLMNATFVGLRQSWEFQEIHTCSLKDYRQIIV